MRNSRGYCLIELAAAAALATIVAGAAVPQLLTSIDDARALGAARYLSSRLAEARMEALTRTANVAIRFVQNGSAFEYTIYQDGNGNGVLSRDIQNGVDKPIHAVERLPERFSGVEFGALPGTPAADSGGTAPGGDPIKVGSSNMVSFSALGTSSTGTLYILGKGSAQYALVVFGTTAKTRILKYDARNRLWRAL
jgi:type II secretory pathway pseudopilin PulG